MGYFVGGLGDGFIQGFNAVETWRNHRNEIELAKQAHQDNVAVRDAALGLQQQQLGMERERLGLAQSKQQSDIADNQARLGLLDRGVDLDTRRVGLAEAQLPLEEKRLAQQQADSQARIGLATRESARQDSSQWFAEQEAAVKLREQQRQEKIKKAQTELYPKLMAGTFDANDAAKWKEYTGLDLKDMVDTQFVDNSLALFHGLKTGTVKPDDPRITPIADKLYGSYLQRGIGDTLQPKDDAGNPLGPDITITNKRWGGAFQAPDGRYGVHVIVTGKDKDGNEHEYQSQATKYGTGDPRDPIITLGEQDFEKPIAASMYMKHEFDNNQAVRSTVMRALGMENEDGLKAEKTKAEIIKLRGEGMKAGAEAQDIATGSKKFEAKMREARNLVDKQYGGKLNMLNDEIIGADREGYNAVYDGMARLLKADPSLSTAEAFGQARKQYEGNKGNKSAGEIKAKFKAGDISEQEAIKQLKALGFE